MLVARLFWPAWIYFQANTTENDVCKISPILFWLQYLKYSNNRCHVSFVVVKHHSFKYKTLIKVMNHTVKNSNPLSCSNIQNEKYRLSVICMHMVCQILRCRGLSRYLASLKPQSCPLLSLDHNLCVHKHRKLQTITWKIVISSYTDIVYRYLLPICGSVTHLGEVLSDLAALHPQMMPIKDSLVCGMGREIDSLHDIDTFWDLGQEGDRRYHSHNVRLGNQQSQMSTVQRQIIISEPTMLWYWDLHIKRVTCKMCGLST